MTQEKNTFGKINPMALGLEKDYDMGGCKCADDTMEWMPKHPNSDDVAENWACYCQIPNTYASIALLKDPRNDKNRRECGVIVEC